ncbi:MAG TPA: glycine/sarcosine/betaine reductase selenoprotein B family protein [Anaerolineae bacterium]|jgi:D-proline reductase (dithiol) PrdB
MPEKPEQTEPESFEHFKNSFSYGSRTDLNFKFLKNLPDAEAALFLQQLLDKLGDTMNDGRLERIVDHLYTWQAHGYAGAGRWTYSDGPFTPLRKPLSESKVALFTSSGHFVEGHDPEPFGVSNMTQREAVERIDEFTKSEPVLSVIPADTPIDQLRVRHGGYDIRAAQIDPNVTFPLERMRELADEKRFGELDSNAYSFVGACAQTPLLKKSAPEWASHLKARNVEAAVLVPV